MTCPQCHRVYSVSEHAACPHCGHQSTSGVVKSSVILIASGSRRRVYRSVEEVPRPLRDRLIRSTTGLNSDTVIIADQRGRKEISRAFRAFPATPAAAEELTSSRVYRWLTHGIGILLLAASVVLVWLAFHFRRG